MNRSRLTDYLLHTFSRATFPYTQKFILIAYTNLITLDWRPGLVVMGDDSCSRGRGFKSQHCILDGLDIFSHLFVVKLYWLFEKTENNWKRGWGWPIKAINYFEIICQIKGCTRFGINVVPFWFHSTISDHICLSQDSILAQIKSPQNSSKHFDVKKTTTTWFD